MWNVKRKNNKQTKKQAKCAHEPNGRTLHIGKFMAGLGIFSMIPINFGHGWVFWWFYIIENRVQSAFDMMEIWYFFSFSVNNIETE